MIVKLTVTITCILLLCTRTGAQTNEAASFKKDSSVKQQTTIVKFTFKGTHIVNMQTVQSPRKGVLSFVIQHRFGQINSGSYNFFGLDNATLRLGLDYAISDRLVAGVGRSSYLKTFDAFVKYKLFRQTDPATVMPVSVSILATTASYTQKIPGKDYLDFQYRTAYTLQALIARKFDPHISAQITPAYIHYNLVPTGSDKNDLFALSGGIHYKFTKRSSVNAEYNYLFPGQVNSYAARNSLSFGYDIETGGHVFQLVFSNSQSMLETQYLSQTTGRWGKGDIYFGFNISRDFAITKHARRSVEY